MLWCLRESADPNSDRFPPFYAKARGYDWHPNVFLVVLNAETKFRRYLEMVRARPLPPPLPDHVLALMHRTIETVNLLYWWPISTKGPVEERGRKKIHRSQLINGLVQDGNVVHFVVQKRFGQKTWIWRPGKHMERH